jgi:hypothetical protein
MTYILHVISSETSALHSANIARDKGKYISDILNLDSLHFNNVNFLTDADGYFFDPFLSGREIDALINLINYYRENNIKKYFIFHIIDLHRDILENWLTIPARLGNLIDASPSVGFFLAYNPKDCLQELLDIHSMERLVILPHFYVPEFARNLEHSNRKNKILLCSPPKFGLDRPEDFIPFSLRADSVYPERTQLEEYANSNQTFASSVDILPHPGYYEDKNGNRVNASNNKEIYCFDKFIDLLSQYRFFFVEPSVFDLDLLKYSEVAEAGACPVGTLPTALRGAPVVNLCIDSTIDSQVNAVVSMDAKQSQQIATEYRNYIDNDRSRHNFPNIMTHMIQLLDCYWENK